MTNKYAYVPTQKKNTKEELKISTLLPAYIQTVDNNNFFNATFETLFSVDKIKNVSGYIGEKQDKVYNYKTDFYIPEISKERQDYQFTPVVVTTDDDGEILSEYFYPDIVNHLRYQGGNVDSHERLFRQEYYSFSPLIDINKFVNYNQYYWLEKGPRTVDFSYEVATTDYATNSFVYPDHDLATGNIITLSGRLPTGLSESTKYYAIVNGQNISVAISEQDATNGVSITFGFVPDTEVWINLPTDFGSMVGKKGFKQHNVELKNGLVIRTYNDRKDSYNFERWIVEGVGSSIQLILLDELLGYDSSPYDTQPYDYDENSFIGTPTNIDYVTIGRGSKDGNSWSMRNRWFHISVLTDQEISSSLQAKRPIIEFIQDIQLYNFGKEYKGRVDVVYDLGNIQDITGKSEQFIDGIRLSDGMKILVINDIDPTRNNTIYEVFGLRQGSLSLTSLETSEEGDVYFINSGTEYGNKNIYLNGEWKFGQIRTNSSQDILFQLYDNTGISLSDESVYPESNFSGSKLFGYKINTNYPFDEYIQRNVEKNEYNDLVFENYLDSDRYEYIIDFMSSEIKGGYFVNVNEDYLNHWHKSDRYINQAIVDEFEIIPTINDNGIPVFEEIYELSQKPGIKDSTGITNIIVKLNGNILVRDIDYQVTDKNGYATLEENKFVKLSLTVVNSLQEGDLLKVYTYNKDVPDQPIKGYYEVPTLVGLVGNSENEEITTIGRNDILEHFVSILERQNGFTGDPLGVNSSPNMKVNYGRGIHIVQNTASLIKLMAVSSYEETDVVSSIRYSENEYKRFTNQFNNKIKEMYINGYTDSNSYVEWVDNAINELNLGKSDDFPFKNTGMANRDFIPSTPAYLGITKLYRPIMFFDETMVNPVFMIRNHDGSMVKAYTDELNYSEEQIVTGNSVDTMFVLNKSTVFPWEILVKSSDGYDFEPYVDYTVFGGNSIIFNRPLQGTASINFIPHILDRVKLFFEYEIYNSAVKLTVDEVPYLEIKPGYNRDSDYSRDEYNEIMERMFNRWASLKGYNYIENTTYDETNPLTWNYSSIVLSDGTRLPGSWRGIFEYFYDTDRPDTRPWEMLGISEKPDWWETEYGYGPYTSSNTIMWDDIRDGRVRSENKVYQYLKRPNLYSYLPVDDHGNIKSIVEIFNVQNPNIISRKQEWKFGDIGPVEFEWRMSLHFTFARALVKYLTKPSKTVDLLWEPENNLRIFPNGSNPQLISSDTGSRFRNKDLKIYNTIDENGNVIFRYGIQQFLVEYLKFQGKPAEFLRDIVHSSSTRMGYRTGGFIENKTVRFVADNFGLVPNENIHVKLHKSASIKELSYSGVILVKMEEGYKITGYDIENRKFKCFLPENGSSSSLVSVGGKSPNITNWVPDVRYNVGVYVRENFIIYRCINDHRSSSSFGNDMTNWISITEMPKVGGINVRKYTNNTNYTEVSYDTILTEAQDIFNVIYGYQKYLEENGFVFDNINEDGDPVDFEWVVRQIFAWMLTNPKVGELISLSPNGEKIVVDMDHGFVEQLTSDVNGIWPISGAEGNSLSVNQFKINRDGKHFFIEINTETTEERIFNTRLSVKEIEHVVIFDNVTNFHDIIYNDLYGIRQRRLKTYMNRSGDWNGKMFASGFIIENDTITSNMEKNTNDFRKFYDSEQSVIGGDYNKASKKLIGYQTREYLRNLLFDDRDAFQFYQGFLKDKGTIRGIDKLLRNDFVQSISNIDVNEEWAVKLGSYGGTNNYSSIDIQLLPEDIRSNPQMVKFLDTGEDDPRNSIIEISPDDPRYIYKRPINMTENQFKIDYVKPIMPNSGYLTLMDAEYKVPFLINMSQYFINTYHESVIQEYQRIWLAENGRNEWDLFRIFDTGKTIVSVEKMTDYYKVQLDDVTDLNVGDMIIIGLVPVQIDDIDNNDIYLYPIGFAELPAFENLPTVFFKLEKARFDNMADFSNYVPEKSWTEFDLVAIDNYDNGKWALLNPFDISVIREQEKQITLENFVSARLYDTSKMINIFDMEIYHPVQNFLPFVVRQNIDYILSYDPAKYNSVGTDSYKEAWTKEKTGTIWWDLRTVKFLDYDQLDDIYRMNHWGSIFPGTRVDVYQWVRSPFPPEKWQDYLKTIEGSSNYSEMSEPYSTSMYVVNSEYNRPLGKFTDYYYFWVKNNNYKPKDNVIKKSTSSYDISRQILNPTNAGLNWISPISEDTFVFANIEKFLSETTNLKLNFINDNRNMIHSEWYLFSPNTDDRDVPDIIIDKIKHSIIGYIQIVDTVSNLNNNGITQSMIDEYGTVRDDGQIDVRLPVPDPKIISMSPYGNQYRPRQSWFKDIISGRNAFIYSINTNFSKKNWVDTTNDWEPYLYDQDPQPDDSQYDFKVTTLFDRDNLIGNVGFIGGMKVLVENDITLDGKWSLWEYNGDGFDLLKSQGFRVSDYWTFVDFYEEGFGPDTFINKTYETLIERNMDFNNLSVGEVVKVNDDGFGNFNISEIIDVDGTKALRLVGKQNGTFQFDYSICTCQFATESLNVLYDGYFKTLSETKDRNKLVSDMIVEAFRQHQYVDWVFKTSLVDIIGLEETLEMSPITKPDLSQNIIDYFNELKPYHVKIRGTIDKKYNTLDDLSINWSDEHTIEETINIDRVSCVADMTIPENLWKAAERITHFGGNPSDEIPGCKFQGTEIDGKYFTFFSNVVGAGYDANPYDSSVLGYDFGNTDIQMLYDVIVNGKDFLSMPNEISDTIVDGGKFYQPLISENRPPELSMIRFGDTMSFDVYTMPYNINIEFGYDAQAYDVEVTEDNEPAGYDYNSNNPFSFIYRPKMIQDLFIADGIKTEYNISQIPQSNDAIFVYVNDILVENYTVTWVGFKPKVIFNVVPNEFDIIKILSYSIGGASNAIVEFYRKNVQEQVFDVEEIIEVDMKVTAMVNGVEVNVEWAANGDTGLTDSEVRIPSVNNGDTIYIVVYDGQDNAKIYTEKFIYLDQPHDVSNRSEPVGPSDINDLVYMEGKRLAPYYTRYFDPVAPVTQIYSNELIRRKDFIKIYLNKTLMNPNEYSLNIFEKKITFNNPVAAGNEIILCNDNHSEFHFIDDKISIHTKALGNTIQNFVPRDSRIHINGNIVVFSRPSVGNIPLDVNVGFNTIQSSIFSDINTPLNVSEILDLNGVSLTIDLTDTMMDIINKLNSVKYQTYIDVFRQNNTMVLRSDGYNIDLGGNWSSIGFVAGQYHNAVTILQDNLDLNFRVLTLDGNLCVIDTMGGDLKFFQNGVHDLVTIFGLNESYSVKGKPITVISMDSNSAAEMRTEVSEGNLVGEYPITRNGFSDYSTNISVIGNDSTVFEDFEIKTLEFGYDLYRYDEELYDYKEQPGITFKTPHLQKETVVVTTYSGTPKDIRKGFKIFKNLRNEYSFYELHDDYNTKIIDPVTQTTDEIIVEDATVLSTPSPDKNIPGYVWVEGEIIGYFEVDTSVSGRHVLKKLIRGSMGTPMGYYNDEVNKYIKSGTIVKNLSGHKFKQKNVPLFVGV